MFGEGIPIDPFQAFAEINASLPAEFMKPLYGDSEAMAASDLVDQYTLAIMDGEMEVPGIDPTRLTAFMDAVAMRDGVAYVENLDAYAAVNRLVVEQTGVPIDRIQAAAHYYVQNLNSPDFSGNQTNIIGGYEPIGDDELDGFYPLGDDEYE